MTTTFLQTLSMEHEFHAWLKSQANESRYRWVRKGVGDDAAVLATEHLGVGVQEKFELIVSSDMIAEGTHFLIPDEDPMELASIGRKLVAVNLSDLAAMGAIPRFITLNFQLPRSFDVGQVIQLFEGARGLADQFELAIVGGDTNTWRGPLVLSATITGVRECGRAGWSLGDAQVGDAVMASGRFGGSIFGRHLTFEPRIKLARHLASHYPIHAATDATDSLSIDLMAIANASGVGMQIDLDAIPIADEVQAFGEAESRSIEHALHDGEDFELLFSVSPDIAEAILKDSTLPTAVSRIGTVIAGDPRLVDANHQAVPVGGYVH